MAARNRCGDAGEIVDHLGIQFGFAARLILAAETEPSGHEIVVQFANDHLQWCDSLLAQLAARAETDFYRGLAKVTQHVLWKKSNLPFPIGIKSRNKTDLIFSAADDRLEQSQAKERGK